MTVQNKYKLEIETLEFIPTLDLNVDLFIRDKDVDENGFDRTSILNLSNNFVKKTFKIDWCSFSATESIFETLIVPETDMLFIGARFFWGLIDLKNAKLIRQEGCAQFWNFERYNDVIVITTELEVHALNLNGDAIDTIPIDPPFERKIYTDKIDFDSPVYGRQTLNLTK